MSASQPPPNPPHHPPAPPVAPPKKFPWKILIGAVVVAFVSWGMGACQGAMLGGGGGQGAAPGGTTTVTVTAPGAVKTVTVPGKQATAPAPKPSSVPPAPAVAFSDGQWIVGTDVKPGRYRTVNPAEDQGGICYVDIKSGGDFLAQEVTPSGKTILQVPNKAGAIISSKGCGDWEKV